MSSIILGSATGQIRQSKVETICKLVVFLGKRVSVLYLPNTVFPKFHTKTFDFKVKAF